MRLPIYASLVFTLVGTVESVAGAQSNSFQTGNVQASNLAPDRVATSLVGSPVFPFGIHNVAFSPNGHRLAVGDGQGSIFVWDMPSGNLVATTKAHSNWTFSVAWLKDNARLISGGGDNLIHLFKLGNVLEPQTTFMGHSNDVHAVVIDSASANIFSGGDDRRILAWKLDEGLKPTPHRVLTGHTKQITTLALHPNDSLLASGSRDDSIRLWDTRTGEQLQVLHGHTNDVMSVRFSPGGNLLASGSYDGSVRLWKMPSGEGLNTLWPRAGWVFNVAFAPDGKKLASATQQAVQIWDIETGTIKHTFAFAGGIQSSNSITREQISSVAFHPDGKRVAAGSTSGRVYILASDTGTIVSTLDSARTR